MTDLPVFLCQINSYTRLHTIQKPRKDREEEGDYAVYFIILQITNHRSMSNVCSCGVPFSFAAATHRIILVFFNQPLFTPFYRLITSSLPNIAVLAVLHYFFVHKQFALNILYVEIYMRCEQKKAPKNGRVFQSILANIKNTN